MGLINFFIVVEEGENTLIPSLNNDNNDTVSIIEINPEKPVELFNNDTDFANFQLGEFGVTQSNLVFHLTQPKHSFQP